MGNGAHLTVQRKGPRFNERSRKPLLNGYRWALRRHLTAPSGMATAGSMTTNFAPLV